MSALTSPPAPIAISRARSPPNERRPPPPSIAGQGRSCKHFANSGEDDEMSEPFPLYDLVYLHNLNGIYGATGGWALVGPSSGARLFNPFSNSGISVSAPARAPSVPYTPACLPVSLPAWPYERTNAWRRIEAARAPYPHAACLNGPVRNRRRRRCPKIRRSRSRRRRRHCRSRSRRAGQEELRRRRRRLRPSEIRAGVLFRAK